MGTDMRAELNQALAQYRELTTGLSRLGDEVTALRATARTNDGGVTVTVGSRGELVDLEIEAGLAARLDSRALAGRILEAAGRAEAEVREQARTVVADFLPERLRSAVSSNGTVDVAKLGRNLNAVDLRGGR